MADEDSILGTSGKTQLPYEYQLEQQQIARKRSMAQALLQRGMQPQAAPLMFGRHAAHQGKLPAIANAIAAFMGQRGLGEAEEESTALMGKVGAAQEQQRQTGIAAALADARSKRALVTAKLIGGDRGASWLQADNPDNPIPAMPAPMVRSPAGAPEPVEPVTLTPPSMVSARAPPPRPSTTAPRRGHRARVAPPGSR